MRDSAGSVSLWGIMVLLVVGLGQLAFGQASFQGLGLPAPSDQGLAWGVSADGSVAVGYVSVQGTEDAAFRWTAGGGMVGLGDLPGGQFCSRARRCSADGSVLVGESESAFGYEAFRWEAGVMSGLGDLPGGLFNSHARDVSADGSVVVGGGSAVSGHEAFRWQDGVMSGIGDLPGGNFFSVATGVSADGEVVVGVGESASGGEAFRWTEASGMLGLGDLPGGDFHSYASDVSADGSLVVGGGTSGASGSDWEAFLWTDAAGMVALGDLPGGEYHSFANAVSADGAIVVGASYDAVGQRAFIWDSEKGMRSLQQLLTDECGLDLGAWVLGSAQDVSADGLTIVGYGTNPFGYTEPWIAYLPEPATLGLLSLGGLAAIRRRRH